MRLAGQEDFTSTMKLSISNLAGSAATFEFNKDSHFGFAGKSGVMFVEGPLYGGKTRGACEPACRPADYGVKDGTMIDFVVQRRGNTITVNGPPLFFKIIVPIVLTPPPVTCTRVSGTCLKPCCPLPPPRVPQ